MISDWRVDRGIGPSPLRKRADAPLRLLLIMIAGFAAASAFIVFLKTLGQPLNWFSNLRLWALVFGLQVAIVAVASCFGPRKGLAVTFGLVGTALAVVVWILALPILQTFGVVMIVPNR